MKNNKKALDYILILATVGLLVYLVLVLVRRYKFSKLNPLTGSDGDDRVVIETQKPFPQDNRYIDLNKILKKGSSGVEVETLQKLIIQYGGALPQFGVDGIFGAETEAALLKIKGVKQISINNFLLK